MLKTAVLAAIAVLCLLSSAEGRQRQRVTDLDPMCNITMPCVTPYASSPQKVRETRGLYVARQIGIGGPRVAPISAEVVGGRPAGCPHAFCGCGASLHLFGRIIPSLNLAANWFQFPRAAPAPGMAAVRRHHVMVLEADLGGGMWMVWDANSGGHLTRVHPRSIARYAIVNPNG